MNNDIREFLKATYERNGIKTFYDISILEKILKGRFSESKHEINVLIAACKEEIPQAIASSESKTVENLTRLSLVNNLVTDYSMNNSAAEWAVDAWIYVLGKEKEKQLEHEISATAEPQTIEPQIKDIPKKDIPKVLDDDYMSDYSDETELKEEPKQDTMRISRKSIKKKRRNRIIGLIAALAVLLVAFYFAKMEFMQVTYGNTNGNLANKGFVCQQGSYIYVSDLSSDHHGLYKISTDDNNKKDKLSDDYPYYINVLKGWIYYSCDEGLIKMKTDGSNRTILDKGPGVTSVSVVDNNIFYAKTSNGEGIYTMRTNGSNKFKYVSCNPGSMNVSGIFIYYTDIDNEVNSSVLCKIKTDGSFKGSMIINKVSYINAISNWLYYVISDPRRGIFTLSKLKVDYSNPLAMIANATCLNVTPDQTLYFVQQGKDGKRFLYSTDSSFSSKKLIAPVDAANINIAGNYIYYYGKDDSGNKRLYRIKKNGTNKTIFE